MNENITLTLNLPVLSYSSYVNYSHVEKPSGMSYLILTIIQTFNDEKTTWKEALE